MKKIPKSLAQKRDRTLKALPPIGEIVRGSLLKRSRRCGKASCFCAKKDGHPLVYLSVTLRPGKTEQISLPQHLVPQVRQWVTNYVKLWKVLENLSKINRQWIRHARRLDSES
jgi:hypothetical protein